MALTDAQQALVVFLGVVLSTLAGWAYAGFPTSKLAMGLVVGAILAGAILALKEWAGSNVPIPSAPTPPAQAPAATQLNSNYVKERAYFTRQSWLF